MNKENGKIGWMDSIEFDHHLEHDLHGVNIYPTREICKEKNPCIDTDKHCTAMRVLIIPYPEEAQNGEH